jgi:hypothetical protein
MSLRAQKVLQESFWVIKEKNIYLRSAESQCSPSQRLM